jgi:cytochrome c oxidase assembly protein subunit 15
VCRPCLNNPAARTFSARRTSSAPRLPSLLKQQARWKSTQPLRSNVAAAEASIAEAAAKGTAESTSKSKSSSWPETSSKSVAYWLLGSAASVFGIVIFGGLTRLTESG